MKRDLLLDAAEQLLAEHGTTALTLAAVAARAGVSKGGLLYHFGTKEALVKALVQRLVEEFDQAVSDRAEQGDGSPGTYTRAYVETTFDIVTDRDPARARRRWAVVAAAATASDLAEPLRDATRRWHRHEDGVDVVAARIVRLAVDGLWEAMEYDPELFDAAECDELRRRLLHLLDAEPRGAGAG
ncbi:TetR/AcrR family transcriptional regulator [Yinghuangia soli]|uniref:TetR/AcrR family transcriptional regulator n=1 Tax=Yinghuangia soli TaxID=2908204 RepID=A0AA41U139_9ACTN|nr:TetR/AcrR family transcriptional regulator [Yinghuangia soli]MCF2529140.1 TetR/AcrR family transcriptional regulator [Yinghuangia soli]